ncbi:hypothetical protein ABCR94_00485 [Streptomyces sp. 21So2-11]|uniref:hypothetical protein n=1 Tax=Streptomyces sp. 21So2-11 TaxID=3144408 RepID=UPI00321AA8E4
MLNAASAVAAIRDDYGPEELDALAIYSNVHSVLESLGLHPYIETRGGLAVCAYAPDGTLVVVACQDSLPLRRRRLLGWHVSHVPEDSNSPLWRCIVRDTIPEDLCKSPGDLRLDAIAEAITQHLATCSHTVGAAGA